MNTIKSKYDINTRQKRDPQDFFSPEKNTIKASFGKAPLGNYLTYVVYISRMIH